MNRHHPKESTLAEYAAGILDEGRSLIIASHLAMCGQCREFVAALEEVGGLLLDTGEPVAMTDGAVANALDAVMQEPAMVGAKAKRAAVNPVWQSDQKNFLGYEVGPWRWVSPGLH